jgi:uncharacterized membrane protein YqaE (UPF0057 family)
VYGTLKCRPEHQTRVSASLARSFTFLKEDDEMKYLLCFIFPPLAILACGKPFQAMLNIPLCLLLVVPGILHALCVCFNTDADTRARRYAR